eukprot:TRINITY_DN49940_c0_g1_i1.p1 TRINITY_DN49940_c0_g1~~TRINITY_DN49940_c0_g1_i1.p1  ORF type:complete len:478 (-),score=94.93 TRINITY_DN49940_c0_g1_i1:10-1380(-)
MAKHRIKHAFARYDVAQLGMFSQEQMLSVMRGAGVQEADVLAVLSHFNHVRDGRVNYGEFLDSLFGEDEAPQQSFPEEGQEAKGEDLSKNHNEEARAEAQEEVMTVQRSLHDREAQCKEPRKFSKRKGGLESKTFLSEIKEVPHNIDFRYDLLLMGAAAPQLEAALQQPGSPLICRVFARAPLGFSGRHVESYLLNAECWEGESKAAKIRIRSCRDSKDEVPKPETRTEADAAAAIFILSLKPLAEGADAAEQSLSQQMSLLTKIAVQYFAQHDALLPSLACLLVFGEPPLPAEAMTFAEEYSLPVVFLPDDMDLQLVIARLASLLPAAAVLKERHLAEQSVDRETSEKTFRSQEKVTGTPSPTLLPKQPRDQFGTCVFSARENLMPGQKRYLCKSAHSTHKDGDEDEDDDAESWTSYDLTSRGPSRHGSLCDMSRTNSSRHGSLCDMSRMNSDAA